MTRDELMDAVREYANREHPGWRCASVCVDIRDGLPHEMIVITPDDRALLVDQQCHQAAV